MPPDSDGPGARLGCSSASTWRALARDAVRHDGVGPDLQGSLPKISKERNLISARATRANGANTLSNRRCKTAINHSVSLVPIVFSAKHCHLGSTFTADLRTMWSELDKQCDAESVGLTCLSTSHPQRHATCVVAVLVLPDCRGQSGIERTARNRARRLYGFKFTFSHSQCVYCSILTLRPRQLPLRKSK